MYTDDFFSTSGPNVRIDTTLLGFDNMNWQRGSRSYIFKGNGEIILIVLKCSFMNRDLV